MALWKGRGAELWMAAAVVVLDQATKWVIKYPLNLEGQPDRTEAEALADRLSARAATITSASRTSP